MEELKIDKSRVIEAANKCSTAKATLKVLFPEVFEEEETFRVGDIFQRSNLADNYILSSVMIDVGETYISYTNLKDGMNWHYAIKVNDRFKVTKQELAELSGSSRFIRVRKAGNQ